MNSEPGIPLSKEISIAMSEVHVTITPYDTVVIVILCVIIVVTVLGNSLVITSVATTQRLQTVTNYFVVSLALSDLLVGFLVMPLGVVKQITVKWALGRVACDLWISMDVLLCTASILNLCCISLDRYFAITSPVVYAVRRSTKLAVIMIAIVWILSIVITTPPMFGWYDRNWRNHSTECEYNSDLGYVIYSACGSFYIPTVVMVYVYWRIFAITRKREAVLMRDNDEGSVAAKTNDSPSKNAPVTTAEHEKIYTVRNGSPQHSAEIIEAKEEPNPRGSAPTEGGEVVETARNENAKCDSMATIEDVPVDRKSPARTDSSVSFGSRASSKMIFRVGTKKCSLNHSRQCRSMHHTREGYERAAFQRERRVAKSLSVVVGGYILCWLPFFVVYVLLPFLPYNTIPELCLTCLIWLGWVNSTINPFIYALNNNDFKKAFLRLTVYKLRRWRRHGERNTSNFV